MNVKLAHARISETGAIDGDPGDQNAKEVAVTEFYNRPWSTVIRPVQRKIADAIANAAVRGCENNNIGYSQKSRLTLYDAAKITGFRLENIKRKCNCDCSSFVAVCVIAAGISISPDMWTGNMITTLVGTGEFTSVSYKHRDQLLNGDILLAAGHTAIVIAEGTPSITLTSGDQSGEVFAESYDTNVAGVYEPETAVYLRRGPSVSYRALAVVHPWEEVRCYGYYSYEKLGKRKWLLVSFKSSNNCYFIGFMSAKMLRRKTKK